MRSALCRIDLEDEEANYTIGQLVTHLKLAYDFSEYEKVEKLLRKREERVKEEIRKEMEDVVGRSESKSGEMVKLKMLVEESAVKLEEVVRVLRGTNEELREEAEKEKILELLKMEDEHCKENADLVTRNLSLREIKEETEKMIEEFKKATDDLAKENVELRKEVGAAKEMLEEFKKRVQFEKLKVKELEELKKRVQFEKLKVKELESLRVRAENDLKAMESKYEDLVKENAKFRKEVQMWREMNEDLRKREEESKSRVWELETKAEVERGLIVRAKEDLEALEHKFSALTGENLNLRKEAEVLREMNEREKMRVWELETKGEVEESLIVKTEEDFDALELKFKELETRIMAEKDTKMLMTRTGSDRGRTREVAGKTIRTEDAGYSRRFNAGTLSNVADFTEAEQAQPDESQAGNLMAGSVIHAPEAAIHISSDSSDDSSKAPLRFKRTKKRKSWER